MRVYLCQSIDLPCLVPPYFAFNLQGGKTDTGNMRRPTIEIDLTRYACVRVYTFHKSLLLLTKRFSL